MFQINLEVLVFKERGKPGTRRKIACVQTSPSPQEKSIFTEGRGGGSVHRLGEKPLGAKERTNNKLNPHMALTPRFEPGLHWWEKSALTTAPPSLS